MNENDKVFSQPSQLTQFHQPNISSNNNKKATGIASKVKKKLPQGIVEDETQQVGQEHIESYLNNVFNVAETIPKFE